MISGFSASNNGSSLSPLPLPGWGLRPYCMSVTLLLSLLERISSSVLLIVMVTVSLVLLISSMLILVVPFRWLGATLAALVVLLTGHRLLAESLIQIPVTVVGRGDVPLVASPFEGSCFAETHQLNLRKLLWCDVVGLKLNFLTALDAGLSLGFLLPFEAEAASDFGCEENP